MENWIPVIVAAISAFTGSALTPFVKSYIDRRPKQLSNTLETSSLLTVFSENYKNKFLIPNLEEKQFFIQTGIRTNVKSISLYIGLKDKLGQDFTWYTIRAAQPFLRFEGSQLIVKLRKNSKIIKYVGLVAGLFLFFMSLVLAYLTNHFATSWYTFGFYLFVVLIPSVFGYLAVEATTPISTAMRISKRLDELEKEGKNKG